MSANVRTAFRGTTRGTKAPIDIALRFQSPLLGVTPCNVRVIAYDGWVRVSKEIKMLETAVCAACAARDSGLREEG
jgi:hypothetical protein